MPSQYRSNSTLQSYAELIHDSDVPADILKKSRKDVLIYKFTRFMDDINFSFDVFTTPELNKELKDRFYRLFFLRYWDMQTSIDPEYAWKMYFERIYLEKIDKYNNLLKVQFVSLKEIENELYKNYQMTIDFNETSGLSETGKRILAETLAKTTDTNDSLKQDTVANESRNTNTDETTRDFNREIYEETPNGQLQLSSQDGSGVISTATNITENLENKTTGTDQDQTTDSTEGITQTKDQNEQMDQQRDSTNDTTKNTDQEKESQRVLSGYQSLGSKGKLLEDYQNLFSDTLSNFANCFDNLFRHVY